jgi:alpha-1,3-glucan synthase
LVLQYGDIEAFGVFPNWQRQLAKFASVQDRLREWDPRVRSKIDHLTCLLIQQLDIDGLRIDKAIQSTVDALAGFSQSIRQCAKKVGKDNFFVAGEIAGSNTYGTLYIGRGRQANMKAKTLVDGINAGQSRNQSEFLREKGNNGLDAAAFHYSIYHTLERFLGLDGNLEDGFDLPENFVDAWNQMIITNDLANQNTGIFDPRHMMGATNQDNFRWPGIHLGTERSLMASYITTLLMPGIPLVFAGEEQAFYTLDNTAGNYLFGRQAMTSTLASEIHSCYKVGTTLFNNFPLESALHGCEDPGNALDHRDPSHPVRNILKSMFQMRQNYASLNDGWFLQPLSNQTHFVQFPGSKFAATELGIWSVLRGHFAGSQDLSTVNELGNQPIWMVYHNNNKTTTYNFDCSNNHTALISALDTGATAKNLFYPHDEIVLEKGPKKLGIYGSEKFNGCLKQLTLAPYEFRAYVPKGNFTAISPMITKVNHHSQLCCIICPLFTLKM